MTPLHVATVVGARPQLVKAAAVSAVIASDDLHGRVRETLIHTGQHYDHEMSGAFFDELSLPKPAHNLGVGSGRHGEQTGEMLRRLESILIAEQPDVVLVYGDTNSTLAAALAAAKLKIPLAHVEAGLRSGRRDMPEEINRIVTDHVATWLFAPSQLAVEQLAREGITSGVHQVGDVMYDILLTWQRGAAATAARTLDDLGVRRSNYAVVTVHRAENTDVRNRFDAIMAALRAVAQHLDVVFAVHPRTVPLIERHGPVPGLVRTEPLSYGDMLALVQSADVVATDSGGLQKEAYWLRTPCVTLRGETEWPETVASGWNVLADIDVDAIIAAMTKPTRPATHPDIYGDGRAAARIVATLLEESGT